MSIKKCRKIKITIARLQKTLWTTRKESNVSLLPFFTQTRIHARLIRTRRPWGTEFNLHFISDQHRGSRARQRVGIFKIVELNEKPKAPAASLFSSVRRCAEFLRADRQRDRRHRQRGRPLLHHKESGKLQGKQPAKFSRKKNATRARHSRQSKQHTGRAN